MTRIHGICVPHTRGVDEGGGGPTIYVVCFPKVLQEVIFPRCVPPLCILAPERLPLVAPWESTPHIWSDPPSLINPPRMGNADTMTPRHVGLKVGRCHRHAARGAAHPHLLPLPKGFPLYGRPSIIGQLPPLYPYEPGGAHHRLGFVEVCI